VITHSDPAAALGNLRQACEHRLATLSDVTSPACLARLSAATRAGQLMKARTVRDRRIHTVISVGGAEMMDVCAGAIDRDTRTELADRQLTAVHKPS
jgi:hypothetical protein